MNTHIKSTPLFSLHVSVGKSIAVLLCFFAPSIAGAQTGPGGVGATNGATTLRSWWRSDAGVTLTSGAVSAWADQSGYGSNLTQTTAANRPTTAVSAALNNRTIVRYTGASSQFFSSTLSGPGVDNLTLFLVANGTSYQSLFRFQNNGGNFVVYPWENGGGRELIISSDGGSAGGIGSGLVNSVNNVGVVRYQRNTINGMQTYLNGTVFAQRNSVNTVLPTQPFFSGRFNPGGIEYPTADVGELIVYYTALNDAQMIIVQNYLAAKYNVTLGASDVYTMDDVGNGNFDGEVAGIGRVDASNLHADAQGTGLVRILNPTDLGDNEFLLWGHNNQSTAFSETADIPAGMESRMLRVWRASEVDATGSPVDVGALDIRFDLSSLGGANVMSLRLLADTDNDGIFSDEIPVSGATSLGGSVYQFSGVTQIANATRFTIALASASSGITFYSLANGAWEANTSWSLTSNGSSGPLAPGEFPLRTDNVVIRTGHTITVNNVADNGSTGVKPDDLDQANIGPFAASNLAMFYHTGNIIINGTLTITGVEAMLGGYTEILSGGTLTAGSNLVNTGYLEAASGSALSTLDDFVLTGNSVTWINTNSTSSDDLIIDHTNATLCGNGSTVLQNGAGSQITYANGGTINQVCTSFTVTCTGVGCSGFPAVGTNPVILGNTGPSGIGTVDGTSALDMWFDANDLDGDGVAEGLSESATVLSGTNVLQWRDRSGNGIVMVASASRPTFTLSGNNGYPRLAFVAASNQYLATASGIPRSTNETIFVVSTTTISGNNTIYDAGTGNQRRMYAVPHLTLYAGGAVSNTGVAINNTTISRSFWSTTATEQLQVNNNTTISGSAGNINVNNMVFTIGAFSPGIATHQGNISELFVYTGATNLAQNMIIFNSLAAKYGLTLLASDLYTMDNDLGTARDDYDHEVAGIGQATDGSNHRDARGTGIVRMWYPNNLGNNEYLMWGHNNATLLSTTNAVGTDVDGTLIKERLVREWAVSESGGDVGTVNVSFDLTVFPIGFVGSDLRLLIDRDGDGYQDNDVAPVSGSFAGRTVIFSGVNFQTGDRFTLGNTSLATPLPVTLVDFTATAKVSSVLLEWQTESEINNDRFEVQRSSDGAQWQMIGERTGAGTTNGKQVYEFTDTQPLTGTSYYRLKQVDFDGTSAYSKIVSVNFGNKALAVWPNPSSGVFYISNVGEAKVEVLNYRGQKVLFNYTASPEPTIDITAQPAGMYIIRAATGKTIRYVKILKR